MGFGEYGTGSYIPVVWPSWVPVRIHPGEKSVSFFFFFFNYFLYTEIIFCIQKVNLEYKMPYGTVVL